MYSTIHILYYSTHALCQDSFVSLPYLGGPVLGPVVRLQPEQPVLCGGHQAVLLLPVLVVLALLGHQAPVVVGDQVLGGLAQGEQAGLEGGGERRVVSNQLNGTLICDGGGGGGATLENVWADIRILVTQTSCYITKQLREDGKDKHSQGGGHRKFQPGKILLERRKCTSPPERAY